MKFKLSFLIFLLQYQFLTACNNNNTAKNSTNCSQILTDLFFVIDNSNKIDKNEFDSIKLKIGFSLKKFNLSIENINIALMTYSDKIKLVIPFSNDKLTSIDSIISKMNLIEQENSRNMVSGALHYAQLFLLNSLILRQNVITNKIVILFSDGNYSENEFRIIKNQANLLKMSTQLMAVRIGKDFKRNKLKLLVSCSNYVIENNNSDKLYSLIKHIINKNC
jgi:hypothetical protein